MATTRREFVKRIGLGAATGLALSHALSRQGAQAQTLADAERGVFDNGIMQLNQNESARGPGPKTLEAIQAHATKRVGRGYAPDHVNELRDSIASRFGLESDNVLLGTGSTPILEGSIHAFCSAQKSLVTAVPSYSTSEQTARRMGVKVHAVPLDAGLYVDLPALAKLAPGAGLVYVCNPNNPSGTVHGPEVIDAFVRKILRASPDTIVHIDEAYINYTDPGAMETALPLVKEFKNVFITRSFSKAHGLAGLRIGFALGHADTLAKINSAWGMGDVNMLGALAALTALNDDDHIEWERQENYAIKTFVMQAFKDMGYEVPYTQTNHLFVNLGMPASKFREACLEQNILVGRDFPPLENTHCRISLGSREEMEQAVAVFRRILA
ncbi:histidinol-phosphate aminotransferase family protein [Gammaproteobacteria bacterium]|nr:histidinol-phosphate aminotransferase family protein [Gammaproteobacteria bacterium]